MAYLERNQIGIKNEGQTVTVPNNDFARLKYYLSCVAGTLEVREQLSEYIDYSNYTFLSLADKKTIVTLCYLFSPDELINKCWFHSEDIDSNNEFFEIGIAQTKVLLTQNVMVGSQNRRVAKVMFFKRNWLERFYIEPVKGAIREIQRIGKIPKF